MAQAKTIIIPSLGINPNSTFDISENFAPDIVATKKGQRIQLIISFEVIEKTKNWTILRANIISLKPSKRTF